MEDQAPSFTVNEFVGSIISLDKCKSAFFKLINQSCMDRLYVRRISNRTCLIIVFEEKPHQHNLGDGDVNSPSSDGLTPSSVSSPTEPTKSTNLEETESSNHTQESNETANRSKNVMDVDVPDTRQSAPFATHEQEVDTKPSIGKSESRDQNV